MENQIRTRFAPSPTGYLHVGGARTALFNWLYARKNNGVFVLRIEDTDRERSTEESIRAILDSMTWLGLDWDEGPDINNPLQDKGTYGPYYQSKRLDIYQEYFEKLLATDQAYQQDGAIYFRSTNPEIIEDFVIRKSDGFPVYNFAVVIDDSLMKITHIIRGDDHLSNTPRQIMIYKALGMEIPKMVHVPMILGQDGERLSKRNGAVSVEEYQKMNILPEAMLNYLARLGWAYKDQEFFTVTDLIDKFSLNKVGKSAAQFDLKKLEWLNSEHIKQAEVNRLQDFIPNQYRNYPNLNAVLELVRTRAYTLEQLVDNVKYFYDENIEIDSQAQAEFLTAENLSLLSKLKPKLADIDWNKAAIEDTIRSFAKDNGLSAGDIIHPLRVALTGRKVAPGIFDIVLLMGKPLVLRRLESC